MLWTCGGIVYLLEKYYRYRSDEKLPFRGFVTGEYVATPAAFVLNNTIEYKTVQRPSESPVSQSYSTEFLPQL